MKPINNTVWFPRAGDIIERRYDKVRFMVRNVDLTRCGQTLGSPCRGNWKCGRCLSLQSRMPLFPAPQWHHFSNYVGDPLWSLVDEDLGR